MRIALQILILAVIAVPVAAAALPAVAVPTPNGDFSLGNAFWRLEGEASISEGAASLGHDGPNCFGHEPGGVAARLTSEHPIFVQREILFDVSIHTSDTIAYDSLAFALLAPDGSRFELARLNPNTRPWICATFDLAVSVVVPWDLVNEPLRLEFRVDEDTYGDTFHVKLDNVRMRT